MDERSALMAFIRRARRRRLAHLLANRTAFALAVALGALIVLLLLGTQVLNWPWVLFLFAASLAAGLWRFRSLVPSAYQVAQSVDRRLGLKDALSTAVFFAANPRRTSAPPEIVEWQRAAAEEIARAADLRAGVPYSPSHGVYFSAALFTVACGIFAVRYGVTRSLDLKPSLVRIAFDGFAGTSRDVASARKNARPRRPNDGDSQAGLPLDPLQAPGLDLDRASDSALQTVETPDVNNPDGGADPSAKSKASNQASDAAPPEQPAASENAERSSGGSDPAGANGESPGDQGGAKDPNQASNNSGENSSLTDKMRDALANLMAKLRMQPKSGEGKAAASKAGPQSAQRPSGAKDQNGAPAPGKPQGDGVPNPDGQPDAQAQDGGDTQSAQGKSNGKNSEKAGPQDAKSGIGKQDGDKSAREAEQLAAMGKISEIIGKRAANVSGEMMVEVASGKQQLRTQYSQRKATHGEAGGEVNRDEIPLAYQQYVQRYFEEIRKLPAPPKSKTPSL